MSGNMQEMWQRNAGTILFIIICMFNNKRDASLHWLPVQSPIIFKLAAGKYNWRILNVEGRCLKHCLYNASSLKIILKTFLINLKIKRFSTREFPPRSCPPKIYSFNLGEKWGDSTTLYLAIQQSARNTFLRVLQCLMFLIRHWSRDLWSNWKS